MIRTQIQLPKPQYDDIKLRAKDAGKPAGEYIRELIDQALRQTDNRVAQHGRLDRLVGLHLRGPKDLGQQVDRYLYDEQ